MKLRELAFQLSAITLIADAAKEAKDRLRKEFAAALEANSFLNRSFASLAASAIRVIAES